MFMKSPWYFYDVNTNYLNTANKTIQNLIKPSNAQEILRHLSFIDYRKTSFSFQLLETDLPIAKLPLAPSAAPSQHYIPLHLFILCQKNIALPLVYLSLLLQNPQTQTNHELIFLPTFWHRTALKKTKDEDFKKHDHILQESFKCNILTFTEYKKLPFGIHLCHQCI